jgi:hypothetical protein
VNLVEKTFNPLFARSVILFVCNVIVYFVPCDNRDLGVIYNVIPIILAVNGFDIPLVFLKSINGFYRVLQPH